VFGRIKEKLENPVQTSAALRVTIILRISSDGQIIDAQAGETSGIDLFDQSAVRLIVSTAFACPIQGTTSGNSPGV
jgi:outer membrane biosynthesis protein TonB